VNPICSLSSASCLLSLCIFSFFSLNFFCSISISLSLFLNTSINSTTVLFSEYSLKLFPSSSSLLSAAFSSLLFLRDTFFRFSLEERNVDATVDIVFAAAVVVVGGLNVKSISFSTCRRRVKRLILGTKRTTTHNFNNNSQEEVL
jgi:hypothetical protein